MTAATGGAPSLRSRHNNHAPLVRSATKSFRPIVLSAGCCLKHFWKRLLLVGVLLSLIWLQQQAPSSSLGGNIMDLREDNQEYRKPNHHKNVAHPLVASSLPSNNEIHSFFVPSTQNEEEGNILPGVTIQTRDKILCDSHRQNALVVLAQKKHSTYVGRDSLDLLVKTLDLFRQNYLQQHNDENDDRYHTVDIFLFHTGDFDEDDLIRLEELLLQPPQDEFAASSLPKNNNPKNRRQGSLRMINLNNTAYWSLPAFLQHDNPETWKGSEIYGVGYRHMCRWFGMQLWQFFEDLNHHQEGCNYRYIARLDEDSFILSPIQQDMFKVMQLNQYVYGYRMCAFELEETLPKIWFKKWKKSLTTTSSTTIHRNIEVGLCGFYTNFFVADLQFFTSPPVAQFLQEIDRRGLFYRKRFGDLLVHTLAVYAFAPSTQIHRFLDFTYQHATIDYFKDREKECISWGSIQAGYNDPHGEQLVDAFYDQHVIQKDCPTANITYLHEEDLSPTYSHLPETIRNRKGGERFRLKTVYAGKVEVPNQGILSG